MLAELSTLLDTSLSCFPIYPDPIVNKPAVTVYKHDGKHVEIDGVFLVPVLVVIVPEILVVKQIVLISLISMSNAVLYLGQV